MAPLKCFQSTPKNLPQVFLKGLFLREMGEKAEAVRACQNLRRDRRVSEGPSSKQMIEWDAEES